MTNHVPTGVDEQVQYRVLKHWQQPMDSVTSIPSNWVDKGTIDLPADLAAEDIGEKFGDGTYLVLSGDFANPIKVVLTKTYSYAVKES